MVTRYLVIVEDDVEPAVRGPFPTDVERVEAAREHRRQDVNKHDGLYRLDVTSDCVPEMSVFLGMEVDDA